MIRIQGLHKYFNKGRQNEIHVINDVSLELPERGMVAIFGQSGCGKTTLLNVIGGLDRFAGGSLTIEGRDVRTDADELRNRYIGYIFQNYNLNRSESCFENVADALRLCGMRNANEIESRVTAALASVGMEKYAKRTPDTLSGGQQQRIAIARAIVKNPHIILADEPTGNLDEANTVMIMDLLKAISKEHLVLLVTHEANLVDYYCDTVIELSDGRVISTRHNGNANGFAARDKNDVYLGELTHRTLSDEAALVEYYGELPEEPIKLRIVNSGGKLYLQLKSDRVQILDESAEVRLREGVYVEREKQSAAKTSFEIADLPPMNARSYGKLFTLASSLKSGYETNFKSRQKGKKLLRRCMGLFAAVIVLMSAVFGMSIGELLDIRDSYSHNTFYLYTPDRQVSEKLLAAVGQEESGVDMIRIFSGYPGVESVAFRVGNFETFSTFGFNSGFLTNAVLLENTLCRDMPLVAGTREGLKDTDFLISTKVAEALLEKSSLGYIQEPKDLIGMLSVTLFVSGKSMRIAGIVEGNEPAVYLSPIALAKQTLENGPARVTLASDSGYTSRDGEATLAIRYFEEGATYPKVGDTVKINGVDLKVGAIKEACYDYGLWLEKNGRQKSDQYAWFEEYVKEQQPSLDPTSEAYWQAVEAASDQLYFAYYDEYYADFDAFIKDYVFFEPNDINAWLYTEKGIEEARFFFMFPEYYQANLYRELYGRYPTRTEWESLSGKMPSLNDLQNEYFEAYESIFYETQTFRFFDTSTYLVSDADYVSLSKQVGETHPSATSLSSGVYYEKAVVEVEVSYDHFRPIQYTVIHSSDPQKTEAWLLSSFSGLPTPPLEDQPSLLTPSGVFDRLIENKTVEIVTNLITMAVLVVLMSVCMYFIMRSSLLNRIKEIGIYRAIGVSRKNLVFRFFVEALVLATLTVFVGYLLTSALIGFCMGISSLVSQIFYYPVWLAGAVLVLLYLLSAFFGVLPILSLLRKTPSEILAKYDI